jgi:3-hydroxyacyl-CoA dehydrogenase
MSVVTNAAKQVIRDKVAAEIETAVAKLMTLKAEAETAKADFEIKAITELITKQHQILRKLRPSKK